MTDEVKVRIPRNLTSKGKGTLAFAIEIDRNAFRECQRSCRIEGIADSPSCRTRGEFLQNGTLALTLPGDLGGELTPVIEIVDLAKGRRLTGSFRLRLGHVEEVRGPDVKIIQGDAGVVYAPSQSGGRGEYREEFVGAEIVITVTLDAQRLGEKVSLDRLLEREEFVVLPELPGAPVRVLQLHAGKSLVWGRCYARQLSGRATGRLEKAAGPGSRVHWVTHWDDPSLHQITARLSHEIRRGNDSLAVENLTDYSRRSGAISIFGANCAEQVVPAGARAEVALSADSDLTFCVPEGSSRRVLGRLEFEEIPLGREGTTGHLAVSVYRTRETAFQFPPGADSGSRRVSFLGVWIPVEPAFLLRMLVASRDTLTLAFPDDQLSLWLSADEKGRSVSVAASVNLRDCLGAG